MCVCALVRADVQTRVHKSGKQNERRNDARLRGIEPVWRRRPMVSVSVCLCTHARALVSVCRCACARVFMCVCVCTSESVRTERENAHAFGFKVHARGNATTRTGIEYFCCLQYENQILGVCIRGAHYKLVTCDWKNVLERRDNSYIYFNVHTG